MIPTRQTVKKKLQITCRNPYENKDIGSGAAQMQ